MNYQIIVIISSLIFFGLFFSIIIFNKKIKILINKKYFWQIFLTFWLLIYLFGRYIPFIIESITAKPNTYAKDLLYTNIFLTNICPMLMIILIIISFKKSWRLKFGPGIATWGILSGIIIGIGILFQKPSGSIWEYIFIKHVIINENDKLNSWMYFSSHLILLIHSLLIVIEKSKLNKNDLKYSWIFIMTFWSYVAIIMLITGQRNDVGGLWINDWIYDEDKKREGVFSIIGKMIWPSKTAGIYSILKVIVGLTVILIANNLNYLIIKILLNKNKKNLVKNFFKRN